MSIWCNCIAVITNASTSISYVCSSQSADEVRTCEDSFRLISLVCRQPTDGSQVYVHVLVFPSLNRFWGGSEWVSESVRVWRDDTKIKLRCFCCCCCWRYIHTYKQMAVVLLCGWSWPVRCVNKSSSIFHSWMNEWMDCLRTHHFDRIPCDHTNQTKWNGTSVARILRCTVVGW